jgi:hypothetical protein
MRYVVTEILDSIELLQAHVNSIPVDVGKLISVIWRDNDRKYVVIHGIEVARRSKSSKGSS